MKNKMLTLVINPGSTSTKIGIYQGSKSVFEKGFNHSLEELEKYNSIEEQVSYRKRLILNAIDESEFELNDLAIVMARGGLLKPVTSGVYLVNFTMIDELIHNKRKHASNLAAIIGHSIAEELGIQAYIADPVVVDELQDLARVSGHPKFEKTSIFHALNTKAVGRKYAQSINQKYEDLNLIIVHMGGGITIGAHNMGLVIDVNQGLDGEGPFSPERSGSLPSGDLVRLCFSGQHSEQDVLKMIVGKGGVSAFLGTNDMREVEHRIEQGDQEAKRILDAMIYQICKEIGSLFVVLEGKVDQILLTGGVAYSTYVTKAIMEKTSFLADTTVFPGENELDALAFNGEMVLNNKTEIKLY
ncbi:MAG: butyrate kinase [Flavobacteriales bacterium]